MAKTIAALTLILILYIPVRGQVTGIIDFSVTVVQIPLSVAVINGAVYDNLLPGMSYEAIAIGEGETANINKFSGEESFSPALIEIDGAPNAPVFVNFTLPRRLYPRGEGNGFVNMTYDHLSGSLYNPASGNYHFFNPENGVRLNIPNNGDRAMIFIGGNPTIAPFTQVEEFYGLGIVTVEYS